MKPNGAEKLPETWVWFCAVTFSVVTENSVGWKKQNGCAIVKEVLCHKLLILLPEGHLKEVSL